MSQVVVVNLRTYPKVLVPFLTKVDRSTALGNPYKLDAESLRDKVVEDYREWLLTRPESHPASVMLRELRTLYRTSDVPIILGCWCSPNRCHADVIKELIEHEP